MFTFAKIRSAGVLAALIINTGCDLGNPFSGSSSGTGGLSVTPSSTSIGLNETFTFQVSGGTAPYQFQLSGAGNITSSGAFSSGSTPGQAQIQITDSNGNSGSAQVSVVDPAASGYARVNDPAQIQGNALAPTANLVAAQTQGWQPVVAASPSPSPIVQGQVIGAQERKLDAQGDVIESKFIKTNLKHSIVRSDELVEGNTTVAVRAVIEDQFIVKLVPPASLTDLKGVLAQSGAHISKRLGGGTPATYLVSLDRKDGTADATVTADLLARRKKLHDALTTIGTVAPNFLKTK